jgi:SAM-dependent methyltransferase
VAELYDRARPSYPSALVDDVLEFTGARPGDRAVEVGAGTGKATTLFASHGLRILALEPSHEMAAIARLRLAGHEDVTIEEIEFERWRPERSFRLLFSGQAWHWIDPEVRYTRAREALVGGGTLAVFWNRPRWESSPLREELAGAYRRTVPELGEGSTGAGPMHPDVQAPPAWWGDWTRELGGAAGFERPRPRSYSWIEAYTSEQYVELLQTHSDHIVLADAQRRALVDAVAGVIDRHGGTLTLEYVTALWLARAEVEEG